MCERRRVLLVEDSPERIAWFRRRLRTAILKVARNYADAVKALGGPRFDLVLLDHDIDDAARNGQDVAAFMAMRLARCRRPARVVVHSTDPAGSLGIERTLVRAGFVADGSPFPPARLKNQP